MASRMILRNSRSCRLLEYAILSFGARVGEALEKRFLPYLEDGETMPSFTMVLTLFRRAMADIRNRMDDIDISRLDELGGDAEVREQLSEAMGKVRQILINTREAVRAAYGPVALARFGFQRETADTWDALVAQGRRVLGNLRNPDNLLGLTPLIELPLDLERLANGLETALDAMLVHSNLIQLERRKADDTKIQKDSVVSVFKDSFGPHARVLEGLFHLAGFRRLAQRIRPSISSPQRADDVDTEGLEDPVPLIRGDLEQAAAEDSKDLGISPSEPPTPEAVPPAG